MFLARPSEHLVQANYPLSDRRSFLFIYLLAGFKLVQTPRDIECEEILRSLYRISDGHVDLGMKFVSDNNCSTAVDMF